LHIHIAKIPIYFVYSKRKSEKHSQRFGLLSFANGGGADDVKKGGGDRSGGRRCQRQVAYEALQAGLYLPVLR